MDGNEFQKQFINFFEFNFKIRPLMDGKEGSGHLDYDIFVNFKIRQLMDGKLYVLN